jgi:hypothetical protein
MRIKPIAVITVLLLVVASLLVAGCTSNNTSPTNQTPTSSTATHDAFLERFLTAFKDSWYADKNYSTDAWEVTWINNTSARLEMTAGANTTATTQTANFVMIFTAFPTTQDATNHLNAMNKTAYSLASTKCENSSGGAPGAYKNVTGHAPQICKEYDRSEGASSSSLDYRRYAIVQYDNLIMEITAKNLE